MSQCRKASLLSGGAGIDAHSPLRGRTTAEAGDALGLVVALLRPARTTAYRLAIPADTLAEGDIAVCLLTRANLVALSAVTV